MKTANTSEVTASPQSRAVGKRQRRKQEERSAETTDKLLNATIDVLAETGYSRFRITDVVARAEVSRGGQTHHFATKDALIKAAIKKLFDSEIGSAEEDAARAEDAEIISGAADHIHRFLSSKLFQVSLKMWISAGKLEHLADEVRDISAMSRDPIYDPWIDRIARSGISHEKAEAILRFLWCVQGGLMVDRSVGEDRRDGDAEVGFTIGLLEEYCEAMRGPQTCPRSSRTHMEKSKQIEKD